MKSKYNFLVVCLVIVLFSGCSSSDEADVPFTGINLTDIAGDWEATRAQFTTVNSNPVQEVDVVATGGIGILVISNDGRFTLIITPSGENPQITTGVFGTDASRLSVVFDDNPDVTLFWNIQNSNTQLSLQGPSKHDFESDGTNEEVTAVLDFVRN